MGGSFSCFPCFSIVHLYFLFIELYFGLLLSQDVRLFVSLFRFDEVYAFYFKTNTRLVMLTPSLLNFCREIYQMKGLSDTW